MSSATERKKTARVPLSGVIAFDPEICTGCGSCELVCSIAHGVESNPSLSRITIYYNPLEADAVHDVCQQCHYPSCLYACPVEAILIHGESGARYIDDDKCTGCGLCYKACPFTPERAMIKVREEGGEDKYYKCDLCKDQQDGPQGVQICPTEALILVQAKSRKKRKKTIINNRNRNGF